MGGPQEVSDEKMAALFAEAQRKAIARFMGSVNERISARMLELANGPSTDETCLALIGVAAEELMLMELRSAFILTGMANYCGAREVDREALKQLCLGLIVSAHAHVLQMSENFTADAKRAEAERN